MGTFSKNYIDSYEKKISVHQIYRMYQKERLVFPVTPQTKRTKKIERISETLEAILLGIALPIVYVSERQDGSLLVLDRDDRLQHLIEFLEGHYPVMGMEFYPELDGYTLEELEQRFPRRTSLLYDYEFSFQIIEYTTPRYMHLQVGNYIERWNFTREQGIRNGLYGDEWERFLRIQEQTFEWSADFFSKQSLNRQYMALRILMYRFVFEGDIQTECEESMGLQQLLDRTMECIGIKGQAWKTKVTEDFKEATEEIMSWEKREGYNLAREKVNFVNIRRHYYRRYDHEFL